jgi:hypothetical protein
MPFARYPRHPWRQAHGDLPALLATSASSIESAASWLCGRTTDRTAPMIPRRCAWPCPWPCPWSWPCPCSSGASDNSPFAWRSSSGSGTSAGDCPSSPPESPIPRSEYSCRGCMRPPFPPLFGLPKGWSHGLSGHRQDVRSRWEAFACNVVRVCPAKFGGTARCERLARAEISQSPGDI